jgi:uncharacterized membrane protein YtjA (UPF0391 family)
MLQAAVTFFILAIIAFVLGAYGIAGISMDIGRILLFVFIALALISFLGNFFAGNKFKRR